MFDALRRLFGSASTSPTASAPVPKERSIEAYFSEELDQSPFFKPECRQQVLDHLLHKSSLHKTGNTLTAEDKKALGLSARQTITRELVAVLTPAGLQLANPKWVLEEIYYRATITKSRTDSVARARALGIRKFKLLNPTPGDACPWCNTNADQVLGEDILARMEEHCTCEPYSKCVVQSIAEY